MDASIRFRQVRTPAGAPPWFVSPQTTFGLTIKTHLLK